MPSDPGIIKSGGELIRGQVAKLVTDSELIINRGRREGVEQGMTFYVLDPTTEHIMDPSTGEDLGGLKRVKARVTVVRVEDRISLAEKQDRFSALTGVAGLLAPSTSRLTISNPTAWPEGVIVGDPVEGVTSVTESRTA